VPKINLTHEKALKLIVAIVANQLGVRPQEVNGSTDPIKDLGADSLDTVELVMAIEEEFEIEVPDADAERLRTVNDAVEFVMTGKHKKAEPSRVSNVKAREEEPEVTTEKLIPLSKIVKTEYMEAGVPVFIRKFNETMASAEKLHAATVRDLEGSDAFEIAMGGRLDVVDINDICGLLEDTGFMFQHVVEHLECFEGENGDSYEIVSYVSYTLPKYALK